MRNSPTAPKKCSKKFECVGWMSTESSRTSKTSGCFVQVRERGSCPNRKNLQHYDPNTLYQFLRILFSCIQSQLLERRFGTVSNVKTPAVHSITSPSSLQYLRNKCCLCLNVYPKEYNDSWGLFRQANRCCCGIAAVLCFDQFRLRLQQHAGSRSWSFPKAHRRPHSMCRVRSALHVQLWKRTRDRCGEE